jgi:hypothetical protein
VAIVSSSSLPEAL